MHIVFLDLVERSCGICEEIARSAGPDLDSRSPLYDSVACGYPKS